MSSDLWIYVGAIVIIIGLVALFLNRKNSRSVVPRRRRREGFQSSAGSEEKEPGAESTSSMNSGEIVLDKNKVCPVLLETLTQQMKQRDTIKQLPVDITNTPEFDSIIQMLTLTHKNMVDMQCPEIPSI